MRDDQGEFAAGTLYAATEASLARMAESAREDEDDGEAAAATPGP